jgi:hypothetical protein
MQRRSCISLVISATIHAHHAHLTALQLPSTAPEKSDADVDVQREATDPLALHDITLQFAGYRCTHKSVRPRAIFLSFQFYCCAPTRSEVLMLSPARDGEACILSSEADPGRAPLAYRYAIDTSRMSKKEVVDFAAYLKQRQLHVELWDADSLLLLGASSIPLRKLMRQGAATARTALECVVTRPIAHTQAHAPTVHAVEAATVAGEVIGALQLICCNYGEKGAGRDNGEAAKRIFDSDEVCVLHRGRGRCFRSSRSSQHELEARRQSRRPSADCLPCTRNCLNR